MIVIRQEDANDARQVRRVNELAFGRPEEADLVEKLRRNCPDYLSLVAEDGPVVGHIAFTPVTVDDGSRQVVGMGLAPMAVRPENQRQGVGTQLVRRGLEVLSERGCPFVVVLGHPDYYPRFGFEPASRFDLKSQWDGIPDDAFMAMLLDRNALTGVSGVARFRDEFDDVT